MHFKVFYKVLETNKFRLKNIVTKAASFEIQIFFSSLVSQTVKRLQLRCFAVWKLTIIV